MEWIQIGIRPSTRERLKRHARGHVDFTINRALDALESSEITIDPGNPPDFTYGSIAVAIVDGKRAPTEWNPLLRYMQRLRIERLGRPKIYSRHDRNAKTAGRDIIRIARVSNVSLDICIRLRTGETGRLIMNPRNRS